MKIEIPDHMLQLHCDFIDKAEELLEKYNHQTSSNELLLSWVILLANKYNQSKCRSIEKVNYIVKKSSLETKLDTILKSYPPPNVIAEEELREDLKIAWMVETLSQLTGFTKTPLRVFVKEQKSFIDSLTKEEKVKLQRLMIERVNN